MNGTKAKRLSQVFDKSISQVLKICSTENFIKCFPELGNLEAAVVEGIRLSFLESFEAEAKKNVNTVFEERFIAEKLNSLEKLIEESTGNTPVGTSAKELFRGAQAKVLLSCIPTIEGEVKDLELKLSSIVAKEQEQRLIISQLMSSIDSDIKEYNESYDVMKGIPKDELKEEIEKTIDGIQWR